MLMLEGMTAKRASGSQTARQKAAVIKAARLEKEKQIMAALLAGLEALEERSQAEEKLALAVSQMLDLGEAKASIARDLGLSSSEMKKLESLLASSDVAKGETLDTQASVIDAKSSS